MALDRFIHFKGDGPSRDDVESVLRNFFGGAATIEWNQDRFLVSLPGKSSFPFADLEPDLMPHMRAQNPDRWIEVYPGPAFDVITRLQDDYTNAISRGIAEVFARYWEGEIDEPD